MRSNKFDGLTIGQRAYIRKLNAEGSSPKALAAKYGVTAEVIDNVLRSGAKS